MASSVKIFHEYILIYNVVFVFVGILFTVFLALNTPVVPYLSIFAAS